MGKFLCHPSLCTAHSSAVFPDRETQPCPAFPALLPAGSETRADCGAGIMPGGYAASGEYNRASFYLYATCLQAGTAQLPCTARFLCLEHAGLGAEPTERKCLLGGRGGDWAGETSHLLFVVPKPVPYSLFFDCRLSVVPLMSSSSPHVWTTCTAATVLCR